MAKDDGFRENFTSSNKCPRIKVQSTQNIIAEDSPHERGNLASRNIKAKI